MLKFFFITISCLIMFGFVINFSQIVFAATPTPTATTSTSSSLEIYKMPDITNPLKSEFSEIKSSISQIGEILFGTTSIVFFIVFVINAYMFLVGSGNEEQTKKAKNGMLYAVIGLIIALASTAIIAFLKSSNIIK